jgi:hypothetical protein
MTESPQEPELTGDELDRALWRAFYEWAVLRSRWAAERDASAEPDPGTPPKPPREDWEPVTLLGVMGACRNAGVPYPDVEVVLWRLARTADDPRDFAELRELCRARRPPQTTGNAPDTPFMEAARRGEWERVRAEFGRAADVPAQAAAPHQETD